MIERKSHATATNANQRTNLRFDSCFRTYQVIWYVLGVVEVLLFFRILLKLLGASTTSGFTSLVYALSNPFALPFGGIFGTSGISQPALEWSTLIAMAVYAVVANLLTPNSSGGVIGSILLGIIGAVVGGYLGQQFFDVGVNGYNLTSFLVAIAGSLLVLFVSRAIMGGQTREVR